MLLLIKQQISPPPRLFNGVNKYITLEKNLTSISQLQKLYKKFILSYPNFSRKKCLVPSPALFLLGLSGQLKKRSHIAHVKNRDQGEKKGFVDTT